MRQATSLSPPKIRPRTGPLISISAQKRLSSSLTCLQEKLQKGAMGGLASQPVDSVQAVLELPLVRAFTGCVVVQLCFLYYQRKQSFTSLFNDEEKETLFGKLPGDGSQAPTDYGSLKGNKVRMAASTVKEIGKLDLVVVGSGLGGLTVASIMSQAGYKVLVLEQHSTAGGNTATMEEKVRRVV